MIRALSDAGYEVLGADDRRSPFGLRSRYVARAYLQLPDQMGPEFAPALLRAIEQSRPDVVIPTRGVEAAVPARQAILEKTRALLPTGDAFEAVNDKARLLARCEAMRIPIPRRYDAQEAAHVLASRRASCVVVKPRIDVGGGQGVHFVTDPDEIGGVCAAVSRTYGGSIVTEFVPGPVENLVALHLLFDDDSRLIGCFSLRKLRIWPPHVGVTVAAVSTHETDLVERFRPLFEELRWRGPAEVELKVDERDGVAKLLEINPRFSGAIHFPISCGVNLPVLLCRAALGERLAEVRGTEYDAGVRYIDTGRWASAVAAELRAARHSRRAVLTRALHEWRGRRAPPVHSLSDPAPILAKICLGILPRTSGDLEQPAAPGSC